jgi:hypothetical protein
MAVPASRLASALVTMEIYTDSGEDAHRDALDKLSGILNGAIATHVATEAPSADDR